MFQYLTEEIDLLEEYTFLAVRRKGSSCYTRLNMSWCWDDVYYLHLSAGATYTHYLVIENAERSVYRGEEFNRETEPDVSASFDWRIRSWVSVHTTVSYGTTFVYLDNVPYKRELAAGFRFAPALKNRYAFFRNFRCEIGYVSFTFTQAGETVQGPVFFMYWVWGGASDSIPS